MGQNDLITNYRNKGRWLSQSNFELNSNLAITKRKKVPANLITAVGNVFHIFLAELRTYLLTLCV